MEKFTKVNTFLVRKTTVSSIFFIRLKFQGYRCKLEIAIFAWRIILNYAYSLFKIYKLCMLGMENNMMESLNNKTLQLEKMEIKGEKPSFQVSGLYQ